jgi:preprotein translocase subunit SecE
MSVTSDNEGRKWIQSAVALTCIFFGYIVISFLETIGDWFTLEAKTANYYIITQAVGVIAGLLSFVVIMKNPKSSEFLKDVYQEILKVVWPDKNQTWKYTVIIMIAVTIFGLVFFAFDFVANFMLTQVH